VCWRIEARAIPAGPRRAHTVATAALLLGVAGVAAVAVPARARAATTATPTVTAGDPASSSDPAIGPTPMLPKASIPAALAACKDPVCYSASRLGIDAQNNHIELFNFEAIDTTRGLTYLSTDRLDAAGAGKRLDFGNSNWRLTGHVHVQMPDGQLESRTATVKFADKRIVSITANGMPALFQHLATGGSRTAPRGDGARAPANLSVHGHANAITYDVSKDQVQFSGDGWYTDGCNEISSQRITYNLTTQSVLATAEPGSDARVHGTIRNTRPGAVCTTGRPGTAGAAAGAIPR